MYIPKFKKNNACMHNEQLASKAKNIYIYIYTWNSRPNHLIVLQNEFWILQKCVVYYMLKPRTSVNKFNMCQSGLWVIKALNKDFSQNKSSLSFSHKRSRLRQIKSPKWTNFESYIVLAMHDKLGHVLRCWPCVKVGDYS